MFTPSTCLSNADDARLELNVRPASWENPQPTGRYNLVVLGAGTAGLVTAAGAASLGAKVALIEQSRMGGDCLISGCVPSKAILAVARQAASVRNAEQFGVIIGGEVTVNFAAVMGRMRRLRAEISAHDSAQRFRDLGVDVYFGSGKFLDDRSISVNGVRLDFRRAVVATGAGPQRPSITGLDSIDYLTTDTLFDLKELPRRLVVIGAGPIGCEMAQAFARLGSKVTLIEKEHGLLPREDREAAEIVERSLERDGVQLFCCANILTIHHDGDPRVVAESHGRTVDEPFDQLLVATGRRPNVEHLALEAAGVAYDQKGVIVNDFLQTSARTIYAAGDVASPYQFTHSANYLARIAIQNSLFMGRAKASRLTIPWCTYTSPELARVGLSEEEAARKGIAIDVHLQRFDGVDRAVLDSQEQGAVKVLLKRGTDRILGATVVATNAGDLIAEIVLAMTHGIGLKQIGHTIHPYPTQSDAIRMLGDQYNFRRFTPLIKKVLGTWMRWTR